MKLSIANTLIFASLLHLGVVTEAKKDKFEERRSYLRKTKNSDNSNNHLLLPRKVEEEHVFSSSSSSLSVVKNKEDIMDHNLGKDMMDPLMKREEYGGNEPLLESPSMDGQDMDTIGINHDLDEGMTGLLIKHDGYEYGYQAYDNAKPIDVPTINVDMLDLAVEDKLEIDPPMRAEKYDTPYEVYEVQETNVMEEEGSLVGKEIDALYGEKENSTLFLEDLAPLRIS
jgi:hypothetical protein